MGLLVFTAMLFTFNAAMACDNCNCGGDCAKNAACECSKDCACGCKEGGKCTCKKDCTCGCHEKCSKDCTCGCQDGEKCTCKKDCNCHSKKFKLFKSKKCNCSK